MCGAGAERVKFLLLVFAHWLSRRITHDLPVTHFPAHIMAGVYVVLHAILQDMGVKSLADAHAEVYDGAIRFEIRSPSAQKEGGVHDLHSYSRTLYA